MTPPTRGRADLGRIVFAWLGLAAVAGMSGCSLPPEPSRSVEWVTTQADGFALAVAERDTAMISLLLGMGDNGRNEVQAFFARQFLIGYVIRVFPDRVSLAAYWREVWRAPDLDEGCWTVAAARGQEVTLLSPAAWKTDGCGHDPADLEHLYLILTHELVHVLHAQLNSRLGQVANSMPWFVEGLAVFASGQLRREYDVPVRQVVASGYAPTRLAEIWDALWRYGVAGSVVEHIDRLVSREGLAALLIATAEAEVLQSTSMGEAELLAGWRARLRAGADH